MLLSPLFLLPYKVQWISGLIFYTPWKLARIFLLILVEFRTVQFLCHAGLCAPSQGKCTAKSLHNLHSWKDDGKSDDLTAEKTGGVKSRIWLVICCKNKPVVCCYAVNTHCTYNAIIFPYKKLCTKPAGAISLFSID